MSAIAVLFIRAYQRTLSPDHGFPRVFFPDGYCRFHPSCSEYAVACMRKYGFLKALSKSIGRILRCNPWSRGGVDPA